MKCPWSDIWFQAKPSIGFLQDLRWKQKARDNLVNTQLGNLKVKRHLGLLCFDPLLLTVPPFMVRVLWFLPDPGVSGVRSMGPGVSNYIQDLLETLLMWLWLMMIPTQYYWWCQYNTIPGYSYSMTYMQAAVADGQSKNVGILEVNWNINLILQEIGGYENRKYHFLSFEKNSQWWQTMSTMSTQHASAVGMIWVMDSIPWVRCASGNVYKTQEVIFLIFVSLYFL